MVLYQSYLTVWAYLCVRCLCHLFAPPMGLHCPFDFVYRHIRDLLVHAYSLKLWLRLLDYSLNFHRKKSHAFFIWKLDRVSLELHVNLIILNLHLLELPCPFLHLLPTDLQVYQFCLRLGRLIWEDFQSCHFQEHHTYLRQGYKSPRPICRALCLQALHQDMAGTLTWLVNDVFYRKEGYCPVSLYGV